MLGTHAEVYYQQKQYYLRDLSGCNATFLNGRPIHTETPLQTNDVIMFNEGGPKMKYLGEGRLAEVLEFSSQQPSPQEVPSISVSRDDITTQKEPSVKDLLKSFFKK